MASSSRRFVVGGRRPATEAVRAGKAREILVGRSAQQTKGLRELLAEADRAGVPVRRVERPVLEAFGLGDAAQGVAAVVDPPAELDEHQLRTRTFATDALVVVLDGITDPQNFGASARSAEAAGAELLMVRKRRAAPLSPAAFKASAGALLHLPVARVANLTRSLDWLKDQGFAVVGLDASGEAMWRAPTPDRPLALVVGAEGEGLSRLVREACDRLVAIPMLGRTASLNAAAALSVALFGYANRPG